MPHDSCGMRAFAKFSFFKRRKLKQAVCLLYDILQIDSVLKLNELGRFRIALSVRRLRLPRSRLGQLGAQLFDLFLLQFCRIGSLLIKVSYHR